MLQFFNKLFNIRTPEWPRVLLLFLITTMIEAVCIWGTTVAYAAFLKNLGIGALPRILVLNSVLAIVVIAIYTAFVDRIANDTLLIVFFAISLVGIGLGVVLLWLNVPAIAYPLLYLIDLALAPVFGSHFMTYVTGLYDIQSVKRVLPLIFGGFRTGTIIAGLSMPLLTLRFTHITIMMIWFGAYVVIVCLVWSMPYLLKEGKTRNDHPGLMSRHLVDTPRKHHPSFFENMREGFDYTIQSMYLRWISISTLLLMILLTLIEYRVVVLLLEIYKTPEELANFLALLAGIGNIVTLPILLFVISRLIMRIGVGKATLLFPICNLLVCGGLIFVPGLHSATAARLSPSVFRAIFLAPVEGLLYNAVPLRIRGRARAFVGGLIVPIGALAGSMLLLLPIVSNISWIIPTLIGVLALAYTGSILIVHRQYSKALIKMLEQEDYSFLLSQEASELTVVDPAMLVPLQKKLEESTSHEFSSFMAQLISQIGGDKATSVLIRAIRSATDARTRAAIINVLMTADARGENVRQLYTDFLHDPDGMVRQAAIAGLERLLGPDHKEFQQLSQIMLRDPDSDVVGQILSILAKSRNFYELPLAVEVLNQFLTNSVPHWRSRGVRILGQSYRGNTEASVMPRVVEYLSDQADKVRLEAAVAVETVILSEITFLFLSKYDSALIIEHMSALLHDPVERIRQAAIIVLGRFDEADIYTRLIEVLTDSSPQIRATAVETLVQVGPSIEPLLKPHLNSPDPQLREMAVLVLSRIMPRQYEDLNNKHVTDNLQRIYRHYGYLQALNPCVGYISIPLLTGTLRDMNAQLLVAIFDLFAALHGSTATDIIADSFRSHDARIRANAVEALESLTTPQTTRLIAPLFESDVPVEQLLALGQEEWNMTPPTTEKALEQLATADDNAWVRTLTIFVLGEINAVFTARLKHSFITSGGTEVQNSAAAIVSRESKKAEFAEQPAFEAQEIFMLPEIEALVDLVMNSHVADEVEGIMKSARRITALRATRSIPKHETMIFSTIEKMLLLQDVPFFHEMTIEQLNVLATVCEETFFPEDAILFEQGDLGGTLYVIVSGRVGIDQEQRKGSFVRVNTHNPGSYIGEVTLFDRGPRTAAGRAIQDTLTLRLEHEPLMALARQQPELSFALIHALNGRLRQSFDRISELTRTNPKKLDSLFDRLEADET